MDHQLLWYTTRGTGAVALVLLTGVVVLGILGVRRFEAPGWPRFLTTGLHRNLALTSVALVAVHIVTAVVDPFTNLGWTSALIPFSSYYRTFWLGLGSISTELLAALIVTSLLRRWIGQAAWRLVHWLAYASWPTALLHGLGTGTDAFSMWLLVIEVACILAATAALILRLTSSSPDPLAFERERFRGRASREVVR